MKIKLISVVILSSALLAHSATTVLDFEPSLPDGSTPVDGNAQGTSVTPQSLITTQYANLGVLIDGAALVTFFPGHMPSGSNGISPLRHRQQIDYDAPLTFTFVSPSDNTVKGTTDFFSIHPDLANCSGNSVTVSAYGLNGQLVGTVVYQETCAPSTPISLSGFGQFHRVVVDATLLSQLEGGIGFDLVSFGPLFPSPRIGESLLINGDFEVGNIGFTSDYTFGRTDVAQGNYDIVLNPRDSHGGGASFGDHTSGRGFMLVANGAADTNRAVWRQSVAVATNTTYEFSGWAATCGEDGTGHDPNPPRVRVTINGRTVGPAFQLSNQNGQWQSFSARWRSRTSSVAVIEVRLETAEGFGNDPTFDDFQFTTFQPRATIRVATVEICWPSVAGAMHQVEYASELTGHIWTPLGESVEGTGTTNCVVDAVTTPRRFYRIQDVP